MTEFFQQVLLWSYVVPAAFLAGFAVNLYLLVWFFQRRHRAMREDARSIAVVVVVPPSVMVFTRGYEWGFTPGGR